MSSSFVATSYDEARIIRDAVNCEFFLNPKELASLGLKGRSSDGQAWFYDNLIVPRRKKLSGKRMAEAIETAAPFFPDELPRLMCDLAVAASIHVELSVRNRAGAEKISSVFAKLSARLIEYEKGASTLEKLKEFLTVEKIRVMSSDKNNDTMQIIFPRKKPELPTTLDKRVEELLRYIC